MNVLIAITTVIGTIISVLAFQRLAKPRIVVEISNGMVTFNNGDISDLMLFFKALNNGQKTVYLSSAFLQLPDGRPLAFMKLPGDMQLPCKLPPEKSGSLWYGVKELANDLKRENYNGQVSIIACYRDEVGRVYKSKPWNFDIEKYYE